MPADEDTAPRVLLVEGPDDKHVVMHIRQRSGATPQIDVLDKDGIDNLLGSIDEEIDVEGREAVGIVVDANDSPANRWRAVRDRLARVGLDAPAAPNPAGTIIEGDLAEDRPRVGVWLMPNNVSPGELEDFVAAMIPERDPVWPLSRAYIGGIPEEHRKFAPQKTRRAEVHAWLAAREEPRWMGQAIGARDLDTGVETCRTFTDWLRRLFGEA